MNPFENQKSPSVDSHLHLGYDKFEKYERFHFVYQHIIPVLKSNSNLLDLGCAKGEFLWFLRRRHPD